MAFERRRRFIARPRILRSASLRVPNRQRLLDVERQVAEAQLAAAVTLHLVSAVYRFADGDDEELFALREVPDGAIGRGIHAAHEFERQRRRLRRRRRGWR